MKKVLFFLCLVIFLGAFVSFAEENSDSESLLGVWRIEVGVRTCKVRVFETALAGEYWEYPAATASKKNAKDLPYGVKGRIWKIVFNPPYHPTKQAKKEAAAKGKKLKNYYPPNSKGNPLGKLKMFIAYGKNNSSLGIHTTTSPRSIGKPVSHGCTRQEDAAAFEIAAVIMKQDGYSDERIADYFERARKNPKKEIEIQINNGPEVVYLKS